MHKCIKLDTLYKNLIIKIFMKKRTTIYLDKEILEKARKYGINISKFVEYVLKKYLESRWNEVFEKTEEEEHKLIVLVECPNGHELDVVLIDKDGKFRKNTRVYCKFCGKVFRIKRRVKTILKGDKNLYWKWYAYSHANDKEKIL
jgi:uncharacterized protein YbaR (Trm112 family)